MRLVNLIQFPPEMDENWVRYGLAKLGQISRTKLAEDAVLCVHNTASALNIPHLLSAEAVLCTHKTASSASLVLEICPNFANPYLTQFSSISGGNCINKRRREGWDQVKKSSFEVQKTLREELRRKLTK